MGAVRGGAPGGSDDECKDGELCWADTTCNVLDVTPQPTLRPTVSPTAVPTTDGQVSRDDPINTSFCGTSLLSVREKNGAGVPILVEGRVGIVGASDGGDGAAYVRAKSGCL